MDRTQWTDTVRRDRVANKGYPKSVLVLVLLRLAQRTRAGRVSRLLLYPVIGSVYKLVSEWLLGVEIPASTRIGAGLRLRHGVGVVINPATVIGEDVMIRQGVTLGNRHRDDDCPTVGRGVEIGAGATIIGAVSIGDHALVGAGSVVIHDVPAGFVVHPSASVIRPRRS